MRYKNTTILLLFITSACIASSVDSTATLQEKTLSSLFHRNYRTLGDLLHTKPGIWLRDLGMYGQWVSVRFQGADVRQTQVLLDGADLSDPWSGMTDLRLIPTEMIHTAQIQSFTVNDGCDPIGGTISFTTKNVQPGKPGTSIVYRSGEYNFSDVDVTFQQAMGGKFEIIAGLQKEKYGELLTDYKMSSQRIRAAFTWRPLDELSVRYMILENRQTSRMPYSIPMPGDTLLLDSPSRKIMRRDHLLTIQESKTRLNSQLLVHHGDLSTKLWDREGSGSESFPVRATEISLKQGLHSKSFSLDWHLRSVFQAVTVDEKFNRNSHHGAIHLGWKLSKGWQADVRSALHYLNGNQSMVTGSAELSKEWHSIRLFSGVKQGYREPTLGERFGVPYVAVPAAEVYQLYSPVLKNQHSPNTRLKPEIAQSIHAGLEWNAGRWGSASVQAYLRQSTDLIRPVLVEGAYRYENEDEARFAGIQMSVQSARWKGFEAGSVLNVIKATDADNNNLYERPTLWGNSSLSYTHSFFEGDLIPRLSVGARYWSDYWALYGSQSDEASLMLSGPAFLLDAKLILTVMRYADIYFSMDNITGMNVAVVPELVLPIQAYQFGVRWELFD